MNPMKILLAVDGSKNSLDTVQCLIDHADWYREKPEVELVTVQQHLPQIPGLASLGKGQIDKFYQEQGDAKLAGAKQKLDAAGIGYQPRVLVGPPAETIVKHAKASGCDMIMLGSRGATGMAGAPLGPPANKGLHISPIPVLLVK